MQTDDNRTALNVRFISLQAQAAVALVRNGGDIGKTLTWSNPWMTNDGHTS